MPSSTVEDYLKTLYLLQPRGRSGKVALGQLAREMRVAPGTATAMVKTLAESGLVDYQPRGGARLTARGQTLALHVLRRHRLVELFLVNVLELDWSEVHDEAEHLEHTISQKVLDRIDALLGHPEFDPHGDPIPTACGRVRPRTTRNLAEHVREGRPGKLQVARVLDQAPAFLQFLDKHGLTPGAEVLVTELDQTAEAITLQPRGGTPVTLGAGAAAKILVEAPR